MKRVSTGRTLSGSASSNWSANCFTSSRGRPETPTGRPPLRRCARVGDCLRTGACGYSRTTAASGAILDQLAGEPMRGEIRVAAGLAQPIGERCPSRHPKRPPSPKARRRRRSPALNPRRRSRARAARGDRARAPRACAAAARAPRRRRSAPSRRRRTPDAREQRGLGAAWTLAPTTRTGPRSGDSSRAAPRSAESRHRRSVSVAEVAVERGPAVMRPAITRSSSECSEPRHCPRARRSRGSRSQCADRGSPMRRPPWACRLRLLRTDCRSGSRSARLSESGHVHAQDARPRTTRPARRRRPADPARVNERRSAACPRDSNSKRSPPSRPGRAAARRAR